MNVKYLFSYFISAVQGIYLWIYLELSYSCKVVPACVVEVKLRSTPLLGLGNIPKTGEL